MTTTLAVPATAAAAEGCMSVGSHVDVPIPDPPPVFAQGQSRIVIPAYGSSHWVTSIKLTVNVAHTNTGQLSLALRHGGVTVPLATRRGSTGNHFAQTTFDDDAATPISAGAAPFAGSYRPEQPLHPLRELSPEGVWTLMVSDGFPGESGQISSWSLELQDNDACGPLPRCYEVGRPTDVAVPTVFPPPTTSLATEPGEPITDVDFRTSVSHPVAAELDIKVGATGSAGGFLWADLSTDNPPGGSGAHYLGTLFDQQAATAVTAGAAPFAGSYRPEEDIGVYLGLTERIAWTLAVADDTANANEGTITDFRVTVREAGCADPDGDQVFTLHDNCDTDANGDQRRRRRRRGPRQCRRLPARRDGRRRPRRRRLQGRRGGHRRRRRRDRRRRRRLPARRARRSRSRRRRLQGRRGRRRRRRRAARRAGRLPARVAVGRRPRLRRLPRGRGPRG